MFTASQRLTRRVKRSVSARFINMSVYAFGLSALFTSTGLVIQQVKVGEIVSMQSVRIFNYELGQAGALGIISLLGLVVAAITQPVAGMLSDRLGRGSMSRLPFILVGTFGISVAAFLLAGSSTFVSLLLAVIFMQLFGSIAQGPANALIFDNVGSEQFGKASGVLNLLRILGAGIFTAVVLQLMGFYDPDTSRHWLWISVSILVVVAVFSSLWTVITMRTAKLKPKVFDANPISESSIDFDHRGNQKQYVMFLIAITFIVAALSAMGLYALFFLEEVVGLENPRQGALPILIAAVASALIVTLPAGSLADYLGRGKLLGLGGLLGFSGACLLLFRQDQLTTVIAGMLFGASIGVLLSVTWTLANDLVPKVSVARDLSLMSLATLVGAGAGRIGGIGVDALNKQSTNLGYTALIVCVAISFLLASVMLYNLGKGGKGVPIHTKPQALSSGGIPEESPPN